MKEQERLPQESPVTGKENKDDLRSITSDSVKNAHAAGDGAMERSSDSIPDEEELEKDNRSTPKRREQY